MSPTEVLKNYGENSDGLKTQMKDLFLESRFSRILGLPNQTSKIFGEITNSPKLCNALLESEMLHAPNPDKLLEIFNAETQQAIEARSFLFKVYKSLKKGYEFNPNPDEKYYFLRYLIGENLRFDETFMEDNKLWDDFLSEFSELSITMKRLMSETLKGEPKELKGKSKEVKDNIKIKNSINVENVSNNIDMYGEKIKIKEYLSGFCYYMIKIKNNNPIVHTRRLKESGRIFRQEIRKGIWKCVNIEEEKALKNVCNIIDYIDYDKKECLVIQYYDFVIDYLRINTDLQGRADKKYMNLYLFEQVFGFEYFNFIVDKIDDNCKKYNLKIEEIKYNLEIGDIIWDILGEPLAFVMEMFEPILRYPIAEKIIDLYFGGLFWVNKYWKLIRYLNQCKNEYSDRAEEISKALWEVYIIVIKSFLDDCRIYIEKKEIELKKDCQEEIKWDKSGINFAHYDQLIGFKQETINEVIDINSIKAREYLKKPENEIKQECSSILNCIKKKCWDYNIYGL